MEQEDGIVDDSQQQQHGGKIDEANVVIPLKQLREHMET